MFVCLYPFYYVIIYSLSDSSRAVTGIFLFPQGFTLYNYQYILSRSMIYSGAIMSVLRTVTGAAVTVLCSMYFTFLLVQSEMAGRKIIYRFVVVTMYITAGLIPFYITMRAYGLRNNFLIYILPNTINAFYMVLFKTFIEQLPAALEESAKIDGAGYFTIFRKITFPLCMPIVATVAVFSAVNQWNSWFDTYIFVTSEKLFTLQFILLNILREAQALANAMRSSGNTTQVTVQPMTSQSIKMKMTITVITLIPIMTVYPFMQKYFVKGIMLGAIKG